tara:strand:+ start:335 stop:1969 length:1635 start_codon:yes stop_codon:yes gene_type:complete
MGIGLIIPFISLFFEDTNIKYINEFNFFNNFDKNQKILFVLFLLLIVFSVKNIILVLSNKKKIDFSHQLSAQMSRKLYEKYIYKNYLYFSKKNTSQIIRNVASETATFSLGVVLSILNLISDFLVFLSIVIFLFFYNFYASMIATLTFIIFGFFMLSYQQKKLKSWGSIRLIHSNYLLKLIQETFGNIKEIILSSNHNYFIEKFQYHTNQNKLSGQKRDFYFALPRPILEVVIVLMTMLLIYYFTKINYSTSEIFITISVLSFATIKLLPATINIIKSIQGLKYNAPIVDVLFKDINDKSDETSKRLISKFSIKNKTNFEKLILKDISFKYPEKDFFTLKNINLEINKSDKIGILGETGSGKTTLINIISGLINPTKGNISFKDNLKERNLKDNLSDWQNFLGYVSQNIYLADQNFLFNITFKDLGKDIDLNRVNFLIKKLNLENLVRDQDQGIHTNVGERGVKLSGGQIQRIGIARALYNIPEILILDEATNALDEDTQRLVLKNIYDEMKEKTIISISHDIESLNQCDKIYKIHNNEIKILK